MILEKHNPGACDTGAKMDFEEASILWPKIQEFVKLYQK